MENIKLTNICVMHHYVLNKKTSTEIVCRLEIGINKAISLTSRFIGTTLSKDQFCFN